MGLVSKYHKMRCPHCDVISLLIPVSEWVSGGSAIATIYMCPSCEGIVFVRWYLSDHKVYPMGRVPDIDKAIPSTVASDYKEALQCSTVNASRATVAMCRRALQRSAIEQGANKDSKLIDQIDELHAQGKITTDLKEWAHQIRLTGNLGAHPDKDGLKDVTLKDAEEILHFLDSYFKYVYILPAQVKEHRDRMSDKKQSK